MAAKKKSKKKKIVGIAMDAATLRRLLDAVEALSELATAIQQGVDDSELRRDLKKKSGRKSSKKRAKKRTKKS